MEFRARFAPSPTGQVHIERMINTSLKIRSNRIALIILKKLVIFNP